MSPIGAGSVNTTWKYGTDNRSASRAASQSFAAAPWHFGQCRLRQLLYDIWVCSHFSQRATCPPSAAVGAEFNAGGHEPVERPATSGFGTFETSQWTLRMSVHRGR